jgi:hypothetical protein
MASKRAITKAAPSRQRRRAAVYARLASLLMVGVGLLFPEYSRSEQSLEYQVKAAFLLNFTKFVEWPAAAMPPDKPFSICILGSDPFDGALDQIVAGESVNGRKVVVEKIHPPQANSCQIVFVSRSEKDVRTFLSSLQPGILTVGEEDAFLRDGGQIAFVVEKRRVRFDINHKAATLAGLKLSSKLLSVARSVER